MIMCQGSDPCRTTEISGPVDSDTPAHTLTYPRFSSPHQDCLAADTLDIESSAVSTSYRKRGTQTDIKAGRQPSHHQSETTKNPEEHPICP